MCSQAQYFQTQTLIINTYVQEKSTKYQHFQPNFTQKCSTLILQLHSSNISLEFEMWRHFDTKTEIKIIAFDRIVYPDPKFLISKAKKRLHFFLG